jgi:hypothetical protein
MNLRTAIRTAVRATLIQNGEQTCSDIVRGMGMDPRKHKGTVHAIMVEMEREGILTATLRPDGKRDQWSIFPDKIRKRDRLAAALFG